MRQILTCVTVARCGALVAEFDVPAGAAVAMKVRRGVCRESAVIAEYFAKSGRFDVITSLSAGTYHYDIDITDSGLTYTAARGRLIVEG